MTPPGSDSDAIQVGSTPRPPQAAVVASFAVPQAIVDVGAVALLGTVVLEMVAAAIQALTGRAVPILGGGQTGPLPFRVAQLSISVSDRLSTFARAGANVTVAVLLLMAIVAVATSRSRDDRAESPAGLARALTLVSGILASVVILADVAVCIEILRNATGAFGGFGGTNRAGSLLQFLAPVGLSIAVLWCAGVGRKSPTPPATV